VKLRLIFPAPRPRGGKNKAQLHIKTVLPTCVQNRNFILIGEKREARQFRVTKREQRLISSA